MSILFGARKLQAGQLCGGTTIQRSAAGEGAGKLAGCEFETINRRQGVERGIDGCRHCRRCCCGCWDCWRHHNERIKEKMNADKACVGQGLRDTVIVLCDNMIDRS